ncbi:TrkH family potassium uptake protein [Desulfocicer niacini]
MQALLYSVRFSVVLKYFGQLNLVLAALALVPLTVSMLFGDYPISMRYMVVTGVFLAFGGGLSRLPAPRRIQTNEAMTVTVLAFLFSPLVMAYPMMGSGLSFLDAFFEAVSAVTTTGLSVAATVEDKPEIFLFARAWMQWYGGLGIVILALAVMIEPGQAARRLGDLGDYEEDLIGTTRSHVKYVLLVYGILTFSGIVVLATLGTGWWDALLYIFAAVSTGGFAPYDNSLLALGGTAPQAVVLIFSVAGGISFIFYRRLFRESWQVMLHDQQIQAFLIVCLITTLMLTFFLWFENRMQFFEALVQGGFNGLSAQSTAGFSSMDLSQTGPGAKIIFIFSMLSGGCLGSTAGGVKMLRLLILMRLFKLLVLKTGTSKHTVSYISLGGSQLNTDELLSALSVILLYIVVIVFSLLPFVAMGYDPLNALFEVTSAIGTAGLSTGITSPNLPSFLKVVLCADMLMGRVEIIAWIVILTPRTWIGRRMEE